MELKYNNYIKKTIDDIHKTYPKILNEYSFNVIVSDQLPFAIINPIVTYIKKYKKPEELILLGYSAGGNFMSHILSSLKYMKCKQKLITYDTTHCPHKAFINKNDKQIEEILCKNAIDKMYGGSYNWNNVINSACKYFNINKKEFIRKSSFNYNLNKNIVYYNIYEKYDPFVEHFNLLSIIKYKHLIKFKIISIQKNNLDHCTDMYFNTKYLRDLIYAIKDKI